MKADAYFQLENIFEKLSHLHHLQAIAGWDESVMMPPGGGESRAHALATLSALMHETITDPKIAGLIDKAKGESLNDPWRTANLRWMEKKYLDANCIPSDLIKKFTEASIRCEQAWRIYRAENNWNDFYPFLKTTIDFLKNIVDIQSDIFKKSKLDVLIDKFSPDINQAIIDPIFENLKKELPKILKQTIEKQINEKIILPKERYPASKQREIGLRLMKAIGFDFNHGRLDVSHHPFCGGVPQDVRITTRYNEDEFITSAMAICHETGHARYEQGLPDKWKYQPVGQSLGMAVHESQSLLTEMQACRTKEFMEFLSPLLIEFFGDNEVFSPKNLYCLNTRVKPGYIRVDADEITYPLHVIVRYEIEKKLFSNEIEVVDLPEIWDELMKKYLGLSTKDNFKNGVMQDVHWPSGIFGYFPAYTLGALIASQLFESAKKSNPTLLADIAKGNFTLLFNWLNKHIHSRASSVSFEKLIQDATGEPLNSRYFIAHLKQRYLKD